MLYRVSKRKKMLNYSKDMKNQRIDKHPVKMESEVFGKPDRRNTVLKQKFP